MEIVITRKKEKDNFLFCYIVLRKKDHAGGIVTKDTSVIIRPHLQVGGTLEVYRNYSPPKFVSSHLITQMHIKRPKTEAKEQGFLSIF